MTVAPELGPHRLEERNGSFGVNEEGDIVVLFDYEEGDSFPSNEFRVQGPYYLDQYRIEQGRLEAAENLERDIEDHDREESRKERERLVSEAAMQNAGVYVTLEEYIQDKAELVELVVENAVREGLKKGGRFKPEYRGRYENPDDVADASEYKISSINGRVSALLREAELKKAGFSPEEVKDMRTKLWYNAKHNLGGPQNASLRRSIRNTAREA